MTDPKKPEKKPDTPAEGEEKTPHLEVSAGDRVRVTAEALVDPEAQIATPIKLFKFGWPNDFLVLDVYDDEKVGQVLVLDPCCNWVKDPEKHQNHQCIAHSSRLFEVIERAQPSTGRRYSGVNIAGLDILSVEYLNGGENPSLAVRVAGRKPIVLNGQSADALAKFLRANKVF